MRLFWVNRGCCLDQVKLAQPVPAITAIDPLASFGEVKGLAFAGRSRDQQSFASFFREDWICFWKRLKSMRPWSNGVTTAQKSSFKAASVLMKPCSPFVPD
jgi:hypothetical protein